MNSATVAVYFACALRRFVRPVVVAFDVWSVLCEVSPCREAVSQFNREESPELAGRPALKKPGGLHSSGDGHAACCACEPLVIKENLPCDVSNKA